MANVRWWPAAGREIPRRWRNCAKNATTHCSEFFCRVEQIARKRKICWLTFGRIAFPGMTTGLQFWRNSAANALCKAGWRRWRQIAGWIGKEDKAVLLTRVRTGVVKLILSTG